MYEKLFTHIRKLVSLSAEEEKILSPFLQYKELKKKDHLLKEGQICNANHFVVNGCLRMYFTTDDAVEQIIQFGIDNWWITDYMSAGNGQPSKFYIQAVEDAVVIVLNKEKQEELFLQLPQLERYFRLILQKAHAAAIMRIHYIFDQSGEERYHHFSKSFPEFVQRIPQYMLASYLGFTPEFLSKIRAKKK